MILDSASIAHVVGSLGLEPASVVKPLFLHDNVLHSAVGDASTSEKASLLLKVRRCQVARSVLAAYMTLTQLLR